MAGQEKLQRRASGGSRKTRTIKASPPHERCCGSVRADARLLYFRAAEPGVLYDDTGSEVARCSKQSTLLMRSTASTRRHQGPRPVPESAAGVLFDEMEKSLLN